MPTGRHVTQEQRERIWAIVAETGNRNLTEIAHLVALDYQAVRAVIFDACGVALDHVRLKRRMDESDAWKQWGP